jgi:hypothetical protein
MYKDDEEACQAAQQLAMWCLYQHIMLFISVLLTACTSILQASKPPQPYHTSILNGEGWVVELLNGHPNHICCELGVSHHVFTKLVYKLQELGYGNSKYVSLEEQLAIFLYMLVTGLTVRHVGEHFQWSNKTISR